jgi:hypothetical protein
MPGPPFGCGSQVLRLYAGKTPAGPWPHSSPRHGVAMLSVIPRRSSLFPAGGMRSCVSHVTPRKQVEGGQVRPPRPLHALHFVRIRCFLDTHRRTCTCKDCTGKRCEQGTGLRLQDVVRLIKWSANRSIGPQDDWAPFCRSKGSECVCRCPNVKLSLCLRPSQPCVLEG